MTEISEILCAARSTGIPRVVTRCIFEASFEADNVQHEAYAKIAKQCREDGRARARYPSTGTKGWRDEIYREVSGL